MLDPKLDTFLRVADCGSFAKAAGQLYTTSTSVMNQINALEKHLGFSLLTRTPRGVTLTEAGKSLYEDALRLRRLSEEAVRRAIQKLPERNRVIRVGSSLLRPSRPLLNLWKQVGPQYPQIRLQLTAFDDERSTYSDILAHLGEEIDVICGLLPSGQAARGVSLTTLWRLPLCVAASLRHPLAQKKRLAWEDLAGREIFMVSRGNAPHIDLLRDEIERNHPEIRIVDVPNYDVATFNRCDWEGGLMISAALWADVHPSLVTLPVDWAFSIPCGLVTQEHPDEVLTSFLEIVRRAAEQDDAFRALP